MRRIFYTLVVLVIAFRPANAQLNYLNEAKAEKDQRMQWWRDARFGMFIHWGLYSIPAGEWKGATNHAEWIRTTAQIPLEEYDKLLHQFNPEKFNAEIWVQMAKDAGMKYLTITTKHHDGFCLWDSKQTEFDVMSTPFKRDIIKELSEACKKIGGIKLCFYHSIMDWHHPDYNERREWEKDRPTAGTDRKRYISYLKAQLKELLTNYGEIGVLWFDGEWEGFWTHEDGVALYNYVRSLQPSIIINNRVDKGRSGMEGMTSSGFAGDFGTPEQEIPATGLPGVDWESCMTMNNNWGYNKADKNYKSATEIIRKLADIASKGGNFLLNVGPKADGSFPSESVNLLYAIGNWMRGNGSSIYGTSASPFDQARWGRITQKQLNDRTLLYLHVFDWPSSNELKLEGMANSPQRVYNLQFGYDMPFGAGDNMTTIRVANVPQDTSNTVIVLEVAGVPLVYKAPVISTFSADFIQSTEATISIPGDDQRLQIRYTIDGNPPSSTSPVYSGKLSFNKTTWLQTRSFYNNFPVSAITDKVFRKINPMPAKQVTVSKPGLVIKYFEGEWDSLPSFEKLKVQEETVVQGVNTGNYKNREKYGLVLEGFIRVSKPDMYNFYLSSDDGSKLFIDGNLIVDNNYLHGMSEKKGTAALATGFHQIRVEFFEKTGGDDLKLFIETRTDKKKEIQLNILFHQ